MLDRGNEEGFDENGATPFLDQYEYDSNGNLTTDPYKNLIISYNHLNLPDTILQTGTANRIVWRYDAAGNKLLKEVNNDSMFLTGAYTENSYQAGILLTDGQPTALDSTVLTARDSIRFLPGFHAKPGFRLTAKIDTTLVPVDQTTYIGGIEYRNNQLQAIYHPAGRATPDSNSWRHEYVITDHLGNTRVRFSDLNGNNSIDSTELLSRHDYFSYGMEWKTGGYKYTYNGKEENLEHGLNSLDFGARVQDPALGRFTSVDRFADKYTSLNGYGYAAGNPVKFVDVNGDSIRINGVTYIPGQEYDGGDPFVQAVFLSLNRILSKGADVTNVITSIANSEDNNLQILENTSKNNPIAALPSGKSYFLADPTDHGLPTNGPTVVWSPNLANSTLANPENQSYINRAFGRRVRRSPMEVLLHELGHAKSFFDEPMEYRSRSDTPDKKYTDLEEKHVINTVENPAAKILRPKTYRLRLSHGLPGSRWYKSKYLDLVKYKY